MNIKTLEYIHKLLVESEAMAKEDYDIERNLQYDYEESNDPESIRLAKEHARIADKAAKIYFAAVDAREDFEGQEWS